MSSALDNKQVVAERDLRHLSNNEIRHEYQRRSTAGYFDGKSPVAEPQANRPALDERVLLLGLQLDELIRIRIAVEQLADKAHGIRVPDWLRRK